MLLSFILRYSCTTCTAIDVYSHCRGEALDRADPQVVQTASNVGVNMPLNRRVQQLRCWIASALFMKRRIMSAHSRVIFGTRLPVSL